MAAIPDLNKLQASLDPAKFQFISIDDEDPKVVQAFLAKRKMAGWSGIDTTGSIYAAYGVKARPTTIIVDGQGRIVASVHPDFLVAADLEAVAEGKSVKFRPLPDFFAADSGPSTVSTFKPLIEISLSKSDAAPDAGMTMSVSATDMKIQGANANFLLKFASNLPTDRLILNGSLPDGRFDLHAEFAGTEDAARTTLLQAAVAAGLRLNLQPKTITRQAYVLRATEAGEKLLTPTAVTTGSSMKGYSQGKVKLINGSMDSLADALEDSLNFPVVNETGIDGKFDTELEFPVKDADAAKATLLKTLGLELTKADRPIQMLEVAPVEGKKTSDQPKPTEPEKK